jgi:hypothetical protein
MTSRLLMDNVLRPRVASHLWVSKTPYVSPTASSSSQHSISSQYAWHPDRKEAHRIKRLSKGYVQPILTKD